MSAIRIVFVKEVIDNLRDRRTVLGTLLLGALIGPITFALIFNLVISQEQEKAENVLELSVVGQENAPNLVTYLQRNDVRVIVGPADPEGRVREKMEDMVLRIPDAYAQQWQAGNPAVLEIVVDRSRRDVSSSLGRLRILLQRYGQQIGSMRLQLRGVNPALAQAVVVSEVDLSTPESRGAMLVGTLPFFLLMTVFMGGMYLAIDATSGEKERQSLEPLLINPVPRWQIMFGKVLAAALFSAASMTVGLVAFHFAMLTVPAAALGFQINLDWPVVGQCFLIALPLTIVASCLQCIIAAAAKGFREAQGYASMLVFIPMIPSLWLIFSPVKEEFWMSTVPLLSQVVLLNNLIRGEALQWSWLVSSWLGTLALGALLCVVASSLYNRPRMIFTN
jgi:sodium transport system permease protein